MAAIWAGDALLDWYHGLLKISMSPAEGHWNRCKLAIGMGPAPRHSSLGMKADCTTLADNVHLCLTCQVHVLADNMLANWLSLGHDLPTSVKGGSTHDEPAPCRSTSARGSVQMIIFHLEMTIRELGQMRACIRIRSPQASRTV